MFLTIVRDVKDVHIYYLVERLLWPYYNKVQLKI